MRYYMVIKVDNVIDWLNSKGFNYNPDTDGDFVEAFLHSYGIRILRGKLNRHSDVQLAFDDPALETFFRLKYNEDVNSPWKYMRLLGIE
jgi:hypothetical protein